MDIEHEEAHVRSKVRWSYCLDPEMIEMCTEEKKQRLKKTLQSSFMDENKIDDALKFTFRYLNQCIESFFKPLCRQCENRKHLSTLYKTLWCIIVKCLSLLFFMLRTN